MNVSVNGTSLRLNIGCRTFVTVSELLRLLGMGEDCCTAVEVNKSRIEKHGFLQNTVKAGDRLKIEVTC